MRIIKKYYWTFLVLLLVAIDQISKYFVITRLEYHVPVEIIPNFFSLSYTRNSGVAFGMFGDSPRWIFYAIIVLTAIVMAIAVWMMYRRCFYHELAYISLALVVGGGIGNLIDRIFLQEVIDFLSFTFGNWSFAIFNLADAFVCCGTFLFLFYYIFMHDRLLKQKEQSDGNNLSAN